MSLKVPSLGVVIVVGSTDNETFVKNHVHPTAHVEQVEYRDTSDIVSTVNAALAKATDLSPLKPSRLVWGQRIWNLAKNRLGFLFKFVRPQADSGESEAATEAGICVLIWQMTVSCGQDKKSENESLTGTCKRLSQDLAKVNGLLFLIASQDLLDQDSSHTDKWWSNFQVDGILTAKQIPNLTFVAKCIWNGREQALKADLWRHITRVVMTWMITLVSLTWGVFWPLIRPFVVPFPEWSTRIELQPVITMSSKHDQYNLAVEILVNETLPPDLWIDLFVTVNPGLENHVIIGSPARRLSMGNSLTFSCPLYLNRHYSEDGVVIITARDSKGREKVHCKTVHILSDPQRKLFYGD
jgi:hypothetical protein